MSCQPEEKRIILTGDCFCGRKRFTTLQQAFDATACLKGKATIRVKRGTYVGNFTHDNTAVTVHLVGDTRPFVNVSFTFGGQANPSRIINLGPTIYADPTDPSLLTTLTFTGNTATITVAGGGVDLVATGVVIGDRVIFTDSAGNFTTIRNITSVSTTSVTFDGPALTPLTAFNELSSTITFLSNRTLVGTPALKSFIFKSNALLEGFYITTSTAEPTILMYAEHSLVRLKNITVDDPFYSSTLLMMQRAASFVAGDNMAELNPLLVLALLNVTIQQAIALATTYPLTFLRSNIGAICDSLSEFTGNGLTAIGQKSTSVFYLCESHGRLPQATIVHVGSAAGIVIALNAFLGATYIRVLNGPSLAPTGTGFFIFDRAAVFIDQALLENLNIGIEIASAGFVNAPPDGNFINVTMPFLPIDPTVVIVQPPIPLSDLKGNLKGNKNLIELPKETVGQSEATPPGFIGITRSSSSTREKIFGAVQDGLGGMVQAKKITEAKKK
jgi:hypothetical protein